MSKRLINSVVVVLVTLAMGIVSGCGGTSGNGSGDTNSKGTGGIKASLDWSKVSATTKSSSNMPSNVASIRITLSSPTMDTIEQTFDALSESGTIDNVPAGSDITVKASALDGNGNVLFEGVVENVTVHAGETTDVATVIMWPPNDEPVANAGEPQEVMKDCTVQLDGSMSFDPDGDRLTYKWTFASRPEGSNAEISAWDETNAQPTFVPDVLGTYVVNLVVNDGKVDSEAASVNIVVVAGTSVSGIISANTTWTKANSPYRITSKVQVAENVTLTIEPGVVVFGNYQSSWESDIEVFGTLNAVGTSSEKIRLCDTGIRTNGNASGFLNLQHIDYNGGNIGVNTGCLYLNDSILKNTLTIGISTPTADCYIERNIFLNTGYLETSFLNYIQNIIIRNNYIHNDFYIRNNYNDTSSNTVPKTIVEYNSFSNNDKIVLSLSTNYDSKMLAKNNYWGTTDISVINSMIFDKNDDLNCGSVIEYLPILTVPHPDTPDPSAYIH